MVVKEEQAEDGLTRSQRRASRTRRRLLNAALDMFGTKGFDATTVEDITERADVGKGTFYRHFSSKNEVMTALVEDAVEHLIHRMCGGGDMPPTLEDAVLQMVDAHVGFYGDRPAQFFLLQERMLSSIQLDPQDEPAEPYAGYLAHLGQNVAALAAGPLDPIKVRRLGRGLMTFVSLFAPFTTMGMNRHEVLTSIDPLRRVFAARAAAFLTQ